MNTHLLFNRIAVHLPPLIGQTLLAVNYWCLKLEASPEDILDPEFYFGGEVELMFTAVGSVFITWDENAGWSDHFSVLVKRESAFLDESLQRFDASATPIWKPHVGSTLLACSVLGWDETPHIVSFHFPQGGVLVGDGYQAKHFGDGDDLLVRTVTQAATLPGMEQVQTLWRSVL